jgi:hypothetical protein
MQLITSALMALWLWEFLRPYIYRAPDWFIHLTVIPATAYLSWRTPTGLREILAVAGGVLLVQLVTTRDVPAPKPAVNKRRSNIPPPP